MKNKRPSLILSLSVVLSSTFFLAACDDASEANGRMAQGQMPAPAVTVVSVKTETLPLITDLPGRTTPFQIAELRPQVSGIITERVFTEGSEVKRGQLLYRIDPAPYQAVYDSRKAALAKAEANVRVARLKAERHAGLVEIEAVSKQANDDAQAALQQAQAEVAAAKAAVTQAKIDLDYTQVKAPIKGRIGRSAVTAGALVTANQTQTLATVRQLDPIYVDLNQPSVDLLRLRNEVAAGHIQTNARGEVEVELVLEDGSPYPAKGRLALSEVSVDEATGSVSLRARFPNSEGVLLPGMYVRARIDQGVRKGAVRLPHAALQHDARGKAIVMVVDAADKVVLRPVTTGQTLGSDWIITAGLEEGERVIIEGLQKVRPGVEVVAEEAAMATDAAAQPN